MEPFDYDYERVRYVFELVRKRLGLSEDRAFTVHTARHTCASRLVQGGADLLHVKEWLGHKTIQTTLRYAHLRPKNLLAVAHLLEPEHLARIA